MIENLSDNARCVLGSTFGFGQVLTYHMLEYVPSPEMQAALDELVSAGAVSREEGLPDMTRKAVRYRANKDLDLAPFRKDVWDSIQNGTPPLIRVFIKKGEV